MVVAYVKVAVALLLPSKLANVQVAVSVPSPASVPVQLPPHEATEPVLAVAVNCTDGVP